MKVQVELKRHYLGNKAGTKIYVTEAEEIELIARDIIPTREPVLPVEQKAPLTSGTGTQGGYTVPTEEGQLLFDPSPDPILKRCHVVPMTSQTIEYPILRTNVAPAAGKSARHGGLDPVWKTESEIWTESETAFQQIKLMAHELGGYAKAANSFSKDSNSIHEIKAVCTDAVRYGLRRAVLVGTGLGMPLGVFNAPALLSVTRQTASSFTLQDAGKMLAKFLPGYDPKRCAWIVHPSVFEKLLQIVATASNAMGYDAGVLHLHSIEVITDEFLQPLGTAGDVMLADFSRYLLGIRQPPETKLSPLFYLSQNSDCYRYMARADGQPKVSAAQTLSDASTTVSPFICLT